MKLLVEINKKKYQADLNQPLDISTPISENEQSLNAYYLPNPQFRPFSIGNFIGSTKMGGACNCDIVTFAPHGNGTHTECIGHISFETHTINQCLKTFHFVAQLITVKPRAVDLNYQIDINIFDEIKIENDLKALVIRTLPNDDTKMNRKYSGTNPPYLTWQFCNRLNQLGIEHLILDLPSVDKEQDGGLLLAHKAFFGYPNHERTQSTITELAYISNDIPDGLYLLNLQIASFESDASPSKPVLYALQEP